MRYVEVAGVRVSAIGLGTWQFGSAEWGYGSDYALRTAPALVRRALELGVTLIDSAELYGGGASERIVGQALQTTADPRFIATKLTPIVPIAPLMTRAAEHSRARLGVERIDLYQIHWPNPVVPIRFQAAGLRQILDRGVAGHVGVSNHSLGRWRSMEAALGRPVISNQVEFSLARPRPARDLVPHAAAIGRLVIAHSPLNQGLLATTGDLRRNPARRMRRLMGSARPADLGPLRALVRAIADAHQVTMAEVALGWLIGHPNTVAIPGARTIAQLEANARAADLELTPDERDRLTEAAASLGARRFERA